MKKKKLINEEEKKMTPGEDWLKDLADKEKIERIIIQAIRRNCIIQGREEMRLAVYDVLGKQRERHLAAMRLDRTLAHAAMAAADKEAIEAVWAIP